MRRLEDDILGSLFLLIWRRLGVLFLCNNMFSCHVILRGVVGRKFIDNYGLVCGGMVSIFQGWCLCFIFLIHLIQYFNFGCRWFGHVRFDADLFVVVVLMMKISNDLPSIVVISDR